MPRGGQNKKYESNAARQAAYRQRMKLVKRRAVEGNRAAVAALFKRKSRNRWIGVTPVTAKE